MSSFLKDFFWDHFSRAQVLADINSVLAVILKYCTDNLDSLTQEEGLSFMDEYSSFADVLVNKGATRNTLLQTLDECEELKLRIERACRRHQEDIIRRRLASPAATTIADNDSTLSTSTTLVGFDQSSKLDPPSSSYSVPTDTALTNGSHPGPSCPSTDTSDSTVSSCNAEPHKTPSNTSAGSNTSPASAEENPRASPTDSDCMIFGGDSFVGSPTFNIDSEEATGATLAFPGDSPPLGLSGQRLPPAGARQAQTAVTVGPNRVVHFSPGAILHSPTMNIQSPGASGSQYYNKSLS